VFNNGKLKRFTLSRTHEARGDRPIGAHNLLQEFLWESSNTADDSGLAIRRLRAWHSTLLCQLPSFFS
jgi:hypothetical protein